MVNSTHCSKNGKVVSKGFSIGFVEITNKKFINSIICSARNGLNVDGLFNQNSIESHRFIEKVQENFGKKSVQNTVRNFQTLIQWQDDEEIRAIYRAGSYRYLWFYVIVFFYYLKGRKIRLAFTYATLTL